MTRPPNALGRKPVPAKELQRVGSIRLTDAQWEKFRLLGGVAWLRDRIDEARVPRVKRKVEP